MDGRYRIAQDKHNRRSVWDLTWYYYTTEEDDDQLQLRTVQLEPQDRSTDPQSVHPTSAAASPKKPEPSIETNIEYSLLNEWGLHSHPRGVESTHEPMLPLESKLGMPPISHILRFYTSVATVQVRPNLIIYPWNKTEFRLLIPGTGIELAKVKIDPLWSGIEDDTGPERLHLLLIESVPGWGEVKRRVQLVQKVSILDWRKANPRWELVSLA
ncbi:unnamed protein product [Alternaria sp. RS040]